MIYLLLSTVGLFFFVGIPALIDKERKLQWLEETGQNIKKNEKKEKIKID